jgi:hypothetical protein
MARGNQKLKAQEKNANKTEKTTHTAEDRKKMEAAKVALQCKICLQGFMKTAKKPELEAHMESKHAKAGKSFAEAFPDFQE